MRTGYLLGTALMAVAVGVAHGADTGTTTPNGTAEGQRAGGQEPYFQAHGYTVRQGDTLWGLAERYYVVPYYWPHIWNHNNALADPDRIRADQMLWLPTLQGTPGALTAADRRSIAEGYLRLYRHFQASGAPNPEYALVGARYYDPSVLPPELRTTSSDAATPDTADKGQAAPGVAVRPDGTGGGTNRVPNAEPGVAERPQKQTDRKAGIPVGGFRLNLGANLARSYDDNLYATRSDTDSARYTTLGSWVSLKSDWKRHALGFQASAEKANYAHRSDEDYTDTSARLDGRYDLSAGSNVFGSLSTAKAHEDRTTVNVPGAAAEPTVYHEHRAVLGTAQRLGNAELRLGVTGTRLNFDDVRLNTGGEANNDDRDRTESQFGGRLTLLRPGGWQPFFQAALERRNYDDSRDDFGYQRSSDGTAAAVGATHAVPGGYVELFAGYMKQDYDDPRFGTVESPDLGARLNTVLTGHTRLQAQLDRSFEETTVPGVPATLDTVASVSLEHRITPRGTVTLPTYWVRSEFKRSNRTDDVTGFGLTLNYRVARHLSVYAGHSFERRDSSVAAADYQKGTSFAGVAAELAPEPVAPLSGGGRSGPYVGLNGGMAMHETESSGPRGPSGGGGTVESELGHWSGFWGGFAGYGWSEGRWLTALELEADRAEGGWDHERNVGGNSFSLTRKESFALSGRLGYWLDSAAMLYGRAGLARTEYRVHYTTGSGTTTEETGNPRGVRFGTGMELALSRRWFGRLDWRYTDYHPVDVDYGTGVDTFSPTESAVSLGVGYRFFDGGSRQAPSHGASALTGPYVGVALGWGALHTRDSGDQRGSSGTGTLQVDRGNAGAVAGAFGGYGLRFGHAYLGAELEAEHSNASWDSARRPDRRVYGVERGPAYGVGLRAGYILDGGALVYVRGARMRTRFNTEYRFAGEGVDIEDERTLMGNRFGLGVEAPATEHLFVQLDYSYTDYHAYDITYSTSTGDGTETFNNDEDLFRLGLGYRF